MLNSLFVNVTSPTTRNVGMVKEALKKQENINKQEGLHQCQTPTSSIRLTD